MAGSINRRAVRWLHGQLPKLVAAGAISSENARAIERHYGPVESRSNFGFVVLATVGAALVGAGIILLIAHNWDDLSRATRTFIAFLPLVIAQLIGVFVLLRRNESQPWRESIAILDVAAVATAISLVSQTYQIQGTFADFVFVLLFLSIPVAYLFRTTLGAVVYIIGTIVWLNAEYSWRFANPVQLRFWPLLLLVGPFYFISVRRERTARATLTLSIALIIAAMFGISSVAGLVHANLGPVAFAGLFTGVYTCGVIVFQQRDYDSLTPLAAIGGLGVGIVTVVLSTQRIWHKTQFFRWQEPLTGLSWYLAIGVMIFFPIAAILIVALDFIRRRGLDGSVAALALPLCAGAAWLIANMGPETVRPENTQFSLAAALLFDAYGLILGTELITRGIRARSIGRTNFGLAVIAALAIARFFDSDFTYLERGIAFLCVGVAFLVANAVLFRKRVPV